MRANAISIVIITHNRAREALRAVQRAMETGDAARVIVIDNASSDGTAPLLRSCFPDVLVVRLTSNLGAAARNIGVAIARTPFVALCDDDTWWDRGALPQAQSILEQHPSIAVVDVSS